MELGLHIANFTWNGGVPELGPTLGRVARNAEAAGIARLTVMDHLWQIGGIGPPENEMLEAYTVLGYLAGVTERVRLHVLVTAVVYREPGLLAKLVTTLDVISGGRGGLGIGAAWNEAEARGLGLQFPSTRERFERLEETVRICEQMWSDDDGPFEGTHYRLAETICAPQPLHRVPVMVGGNGERKTLRLVAQHADACNLVLGGDDPAAEARHKLAVLRAHCEDVGRPYEEVRRTVMLPRPLDPAHDADRFLARMEELASVGIQEVHVVPLGAAAADPVGFVRDLGAHVVPQLSRI